MMFKREEKEAEEEDDVQRHFSVKSLCSFDRFGDNLETELNRDVVKYFEVHEKERLSKKLTRYETRHSVPNSWSELNLKNKLY